MAAIDSCSSNRANGLLPLQTSEPLEAKICYWPLVLLVDLLQCSSSPSGTPRFARFMGHIDRVFVSLWIEQAPPAARDAAAAQCERQ